MVSLRARSGERNRDRSNGTSVSVVVYATPSNEDHRKVVHTVRCSTTGRFLPIARVVKSADAASSVSSSTSTSTSSSSSTSVSGTGAVRHKGETSGLGSDLARQLFDVVTDEEALAKRLERNTAKRLKKRVRLNDDTRVLR
jgi:hypothetical protein